MIASNLKKLRKVYGYTQKSFAKEIGITRQAYASYEEERSEPNLRVFLKMCRIFGVTMEECLEKDITIETTHKIKA